MVRLSSNGGLLEAPRLHPPPGKYWRVCGRFPDAGLLVEEGETAELFFEQGLFSRHVLRRLGRDGVLDPSFLPISILGTVTTSAVPVSTLVLPSGKVVVLDLERLRGFLPDGQPDPGFVTSEGRRHHYLPPYKTTPLFPLRDGRFLAAGVFRQDGPGGTVQRSGLVRFSADGRIDANFVAEAADPRAEYPDGRLLVAPSSFEGGLARWTSVGVPETVLIPSGQFSKALLLPDGKFLALRGELVDGELVRFLPDGTPDPSFDAGLGRPLRMFPVENSIDRTEVLALVRLNDGRLLAGGNFYRAGNAPAGALAFLDPDGRALPGAGIGVESATALIASVAVDAQQRLLIAGTFSSVNGRFRQRVARLHPDGSLDESFRAEVESLNLPLRVRSRADGGVLVGDARGEYSGDEYVTLLDHLGRRVPGFSSVEIRSLEPFSSLEAAPDGSPILAGSFGVVRLNAATGARDRSFRLGGDRSVFPRVFQPMITRPLADGTFITGGQGTFEKLRRHAPNGALLGRLGWDVPFGITVVTPQADGKWLVGTRAEWGDFEPSVMRVLANGGVDATFSAPATLQRGVDGLHVQADGRIILTGAFGALGGRERPNVARLNADGILDDSFNAGSGATLGSGRSYFSVSESLLMPDESVVLAGYFDRFSGHPRTSLVRLRNAGLPAVPSLGRGRLVNVSARASVGPGEQVVIGGFVLAGEGSRRIIIRALGPSLAAQGLGGLLPHPRLRLFDAAGQVLASNERWRDTDVAALVAAGLQPASEVESALVADLGAGAYTVQVDDPSGASGNVLLETYDLAPDGAARVVNFSTRAVAHPLPPADRPQDRSPIIGGFVVRGGGCKVLVRALGPSLAQAGIAAPSSDLRLVLRSAAGFYYRLNEAWREQPSSSAVARIEATPFAPPNPRECAVVADLPEGSYTVVLEPVADENSSGVGVANVEIYELP